MGGMEECLCWSKFRCPLYGRKVKLSLLRQTINVKSENVVGRRQELGCLYTSFFVSKMAFIVQARCDTLSDRASILAIY